MLIVEPIVIRPGKRPLAIVMTVFIGMAILMITEPEIRDTGLYFSILFLGLISFVFYKLYQSGITLDDHAISYKPPFVKQTVIRWEEVREARLDLQYHGHGASSHFEILGTNGKISVQTGFYNRKSLQVLSEMLVRKALQAQIPERIQKMAEGRFPWYIF